jgi:lambda repressor-like predicted transcriptional regulator
VVQARRLRREGFALRPIAKRPRISVNTLRNALGAANKGGSKLEAA